MKTFALGIVVSLVFFTGAGTFAQEALYEGFDYRGKDLDGFDGGSGGWSGEWRKSMEGGFLVKEPSLSHSDSDGRKLAVSGGRVEIRSTRTAGSYRDFDVSSLGSGTDAPKVLWISFLARVEGAPFDASGDEASIILRDAGNQPVLVVGVLGKLDLWRLKAQGGGKAQFSQGAAGFPPTQSSWIVVRLSVDPSDANFASAFLWINPDMKNEPAVDTTAASIRNIDGWNEDLFASLQRLRVGLVDAETGEEKFLEFDEFRMGTIFQAVAPFQKP